MSQPSRFTSKLLSTTVLAGAVLLLAAGSAMALPAPTLFLTTGGTVTSGNTGFAITGLAQDPTTGILYGVSNNKSPITPKALLTINPATGAATTVGPLGRIIADITFDSQGRLFGWSEDEDALASIDKATGASTAFVEELNTEGSASAFDRNDNYWLFPDHEDGNYYTIDTSNGVGTFRGTLTPIDAVSSNVSAAAWDCARTTLYATLNNFGDPPANLVTIDPVTGILVNKGSLPTGADGLEWYCPLAFEFTSGPIEVAAKNQTLSFNVVRGPRIKGLASVNFATVNGSAKAGQDYFAAGGTLAFANNGTGGTVTIAIKGNPKAGNNRKFEVALSNPSSGGSVGAPLQITILAAKPKPAKVKGPKQTGSDRPVFTLKSSQIPARFRCKLDKGKFKGCGKNSKKGKKYKTPELEPGKHTLKVQVVNGAGKKSKPAKKVFTVLP